MTVEMRPERKGEGAGESAFPLLLPPFFTFRARSAFFSHRKKTRSARVPMHVSSGWAEEGDDGRSPSAHRVYRLHGGFFDIERTAEQMQGWALDAGRLRRLDEEAFERGEGAGRAVVRTCSSLECLWKRLWWGWGGGEGKTTPTLSPSLLRRPSSRNLIDLA